MEEGGPNMDSCDNGWSSPQVSVLKKAGTGWGVPQAPSASSVRVKDKRSLFKVFAHRQRSGAERRKGCVGQED